MNRYLFHTAFISIFCFLQSKAIAQEDTIIGTYKIINVNDSSLMGQYFCIVSDSINNFKVLFDTKKFKKPCLDSVLKLKLERADYIPMGDGTSLGGFTGGFYSNGILILEKYENIYIVKEIITPENNNQNLQDTLVSTSCFENGGVIAFFFDDFSGEGNDGRLFFKNDSIIEKIEFSYATSMVFVTQEYLFKQNKIVQFKNKTSYIKPDKSGYISEDSISVEGDKIFKNDNFDEKLYHRLLTTISEKNPCWSGW